MRDTRYTAGPDCRDRKHTACDGRALDDERDEIVACMCACHLSRQAQARNRAQRRARLTSQNK